MYFSVLFCFFLTGKRHKSNNIQGIQGVHTESSHSLYPPLILRAKLHLHRFSVHECNLPCNLHFFPCHSSKILFFLPYGVDAP